MSVRIKIEATPLFPFIFGLAVFLSVLCAHAVDYFLHEYAHSFMAWALGWKGDPFLLDYGRPTIDNILMQQQIDENVDYGPIFAGGHGWQAALIAGSGPLLANGGGAIVCDRLVLALARRGVTSVRAALSLWSVTWLGAFNVFNVWSYAPLRALATHADMALLARGLGVSRWVMFPFVTGFALWLVFRFAAVVLPRAQESLAPCDPRRIFGVTVIAATVPFYSIVGLSGHYGLASVLMCMASLFLFVPVLIAGYANAIRA